MSEAFLSGRVILHHGDSREVLRGLSDNSIDSVVTDPPYALVSIVKRFGKNGAAPAKGNAAYERASAGFMGKQWDTGETAFAVEFWAEVYRVLKPGGHVIAASGTRTYHRLAVAIEDAGFEIRDMISWLYGSGFPKSHDAAQSIEKFLTTGKARRPDRDLGGLSRDRFSGSEEDGLIAATGGRVPLTTPEAAKWQGWGTALKPAAEPWVLARKPLCGTVAANVLAHGTGALNIDGCRVEIGLADDPRLGGNGSWKTSQEQSGDTVSLPRGEVASSPLGRWPANVIHDGSEEVVAAFPNAVGQQGATGPQHANEREIYGQYGPRPFAAPRNDAGSAARFFYSSKADADDRLGSKHPTVKPVDLMQYLCRLVTPPGGTVLDPFAGSGTTGEAAWREGFNAILIEREEEYCADIRERLKVANAGPMTRKAATHRQKPKAEPEGLFAHSYDAKAAE